MSRVEGSLCVDVPVHHIGLEAMRVKGFCRLILSFCTAVHLAA